MSSDITLYRVDDRANTSSSTASVGTWAIVTRDLIQESLFINASVGTRAIVTRDLIQESLFIDEWNKGKMEMFDYCDYCGTRHNYAFDKCIRCGKR